MSELSAADEMELRAYFTSYLPSAPGERSGFGALCTRLAVGGAKHSSEQPTPGTPWTELVGCSSERAVANIDGEEAMIAYLDGRSRFRKVCEALLRLSGRDGAVLEAYYGCDHREHVLGEFAAVAALTDTVVKKNRARASRGIHEPVEATVRWLTTAGAPEARSALEQAKQEAEEAVRAARCAFAAAHRAA